MMEKPQHVERSAQESQQGCLGRAATGTHCPHPNESPCLEQAPHEPTHPKRAPAPQMSPPVQRSPASLSSAPGCGARCRGSRNRHTPGSKRHLCPSTFQLCTRMGTWQHEAQPALAPGSPSAWLGLKAQRGQAKSHPEIHQRVPTARPRDTRAFRGAVLTPEVHSSLPNPRLGTSA